MKSSEYRRSVTKLAWMKTQTSQASRREARRFRWNDHPSKAFRKSEVVRQYCCSEENSNHTPYRPDHPKRFYRRTIFRRFPSDSPDAYGPHPGPRRQSLIE